MYWRPDALGITKARHAVEIEAKVSKADFLKDREKPQFSIRENGTDHWVRQFYYVVPRDLTAFAMENLPKWAGLLQPSTHYWGALEVVVKAPVNKAAKKFSIRNMVYCVMAQTNQLISAVEELMNKADSKLLEDLESSRRAYTQLWQEHRKLEEQHWNLKQKEHEHKSNDTTLHTRG
jgi:hypothetical protein